MAYVGYALVVIIGYLVGAIPFAYILVQRLGGEDITSHGTGNIGAMNVKRTTGSWAWFTVDMVLDGLKGLVPVLLARFWLAPLLGLDAVLASYLALIAAVAGHNYSIYMMVLKGRIMGGKGLATAGGGMLGVNWTFVAVAVAVALLVIFLTRYLLAGQITVTIAMPLYAWFISPRDFWYVLALCAVVLIKHGPRVPGLLSGEEPRWNVKDYKLVP